MRVVIRAAPRDETTASDQFPQSPLRAPQGFSHPIAPTSAPGSDNNPDGCRTGRSTFRAHTAGTRVTQRARRGHNRPQSAESKPLEVCSGNREQPCPHEEELQSLT